MILSSTTLDAWGAGVATVVALLAYAAAAATGSPRVLVPALVAHLATLAVAALGHPVRFGFAPVLSFTAWLVLAVHTWESRAYPALGARRWLCAMGIAAVTVATLYPGTAMHAQASAGFATHLVLGISSYGLFAAAVVHAMLSARAEKRLRLATSDPGGVPLLTLERLTFRLVDIGFVLLSATLLAGAWYALPEQGGNGLRLDHKTVFSVLAWLTFAVLVFGRMRFGWRGSGAARVLYLGAGFLMLAYVGSRFVLEVLLGRSST